MNNQATHPTTERAIFAGGCFWGVEYYMRKIPGVVSIQPGYIGGTIHNPSYEEVYQDNTGHAEAVCILFDTNQTSYEVLAKTFFEIHDPTQADGQGPDIGNRYRSEVFYTTPQQKVIAEQLIARLKELGHNVITQVTPAAKFWVAEEYHQDYYNKKGTLPYCHGYTKRF